MSLEAFFYPKSIRGLAACMLATIAASIVSMVLCRVVLPPTVAFWCMLLLYAIGVTFVLWYGISLFMVIGRRQTP